jgi:hypothetical protein
MVHFAHIIEHRFSWTASSYDIAARAFAAFIMAASLSQPMFAGMPLETEQRLLDVEILNCSEATIENLEVFTTPDLVEAGRVIDPRELPTGLVIEVRIFRERRLQWSLFAFGEMPKAGEWQTLDEPARATWFYTGEAEPVCSAFSGKDRQKILSSIDDGGCDTFPPVGLCMLGAKVARPITTAEALWLP